eukprot:TRINITY_DN1269_c1_g1_i1.p1 TRINITY_DN1269_c1_g1~~TRINITY_DN1269_c1_g1_i1.p1  ORF type:complete len:201 (+),score=48.19 TRINITY_DN1269_c1_g1_i1:38-640(+)
MAIKQHQKVVMVGEMNVGKTSIVSRFINNRFNEKTRTTVGSSCAYKTITVDEEDVSFCLWDTAGQEAYHSLVDLYFREAAAVVLVFDLTSPGSLDKAKSWHSKVEQHAPKDVVVALVGNKADMKDKRKVLDSDARDSAEQIDAFYTAVSAMTGDDIEQLFENIAKKIRIRAKAKTAPPQGEKAPETITLSSNRSASRCKC